MRAFVAGAYLNAVEAWNAAAFWNGVGALALNYQPPPSPAPVPVRPTPSRPHIAAAPGGGSSPPASGGCGSLPGYIVQRESGGNPNAVNPSSGAFGCAQLLPSHFTAGGACAGLSYEACVNKLWAGGAGSSNWAATR